jgi:predicted transcriptional regulator
MPETVTLAAEAVANYRMTQERQLQAIKEGLAAVRRGDMVPHEVVMTWLDGWGTNHELPRPHPQRRS